MSLKVLPLVLTGVLASTAVAQPAQLGAGEASFRVSLRGAPIGTAMSTVIRTPTGWTIQGTGELAAPLGLTVRRLEVNYTDDWMPRDVTLDLATSEESLVVHGGFGGGATSRVDLVRNRQVVFVTASVSPDAVILPNLAFGAYEALAARLALATPGTRLTAYVVPQREVAIRLDTVEDQNLRGTTGPIRTKRWRVTFLNPDGEVPADIWVDGQRLARFELPNQGLAVVRQDVSSD